LDTVAKGEVAESHLDALIERRHEQRVASEGERRELEDWQVTERREDAQKREAQVWAWIAFRRAQIQRRRRTCQVLDARDEAEIGRLSTMLKSGELWPKKNGHEEMSA
jgi:hypothetical protein